MFGSKVWDLRVGEAGAEGGVEFGETVWDGEVGAIGEVLAAFEFKGIELVASTKFTLLKPLSRIRISPPPLQMAVERELGST